MLEERPFSVDEQWMRDALCVEFPDRADDWFPRSKGSVEEVRAKLTCTRCLCQQACLAYAIAQDVRDGIWGGATPAERKELVKSGLLTATLIAQWGYRAMQGRIIERDREAEEQRWTAIYAELGNAAVSADA